MSRLDLGQGRVQIGGLDAQEGHHRIVGGDAAGHLLQLPRDRRRPSGQVHRRIGQQIVLDHVVARHAQQMMGQSGQEPRPILARRTVDQHRSVLIGQGLEIAAEYIPVRRIERQAAIGVLHEPPAGRRREVLGLQKGDVGRLHPVVDPALDHPARPAVRTARRLVATLAGPTQIDHRADIQSAQPLQIRRARPRMVGGTEQMAGP